MNAVSTPIPGLLVIEPRVFTDDRGAFLETYQVDRYAELGLPPFVQDNVSWSRRGVLRGLHFQFPNAQGKLVTVLHGAVFDVAVDVRLGSPHFGRWFGVELSAENHRQFYIPPGFAHGFAVTSELAVFTYKCSDFYHPASERTIRWDDAAVGIDWPVEAPVVSPKDAAGALLEDLRPDEFPTYVS